MGSYRDLEGEAAGSYRELGNFDFGRDRSSWLEFSGGRGLSYHELSRPGGEFVSGYLDLAGKRLGRMFSPPRQGILRRNKCNKRDNAMFARVFCDFEVCTGVCT